MDYVRCHDAIIQNAVKRGWVKCPSRTLERHHIVPRSMGGGDEPENLVNLTPREHFIVHKLLWKIHRNRRMAWAYVTLSRMSCDSRKRCSAREYEKARILASRLSSERMRVNNPNSGQVGAKSSKFKGWFITPWGRFGSVYEAEKAGPGIGKSTIQRRCTKPDSIIRSGRAGSAFYGKTPRELGYGFEESK